MVARCGCSLSPTSSTATETHCSTRTCKGEQGAQGVSELGNTYWHTWQHPSPANRQYYDCQPPPVHSTCTLLRLHKKEPRSAQPSKNQSVAPHYTNELLPSPYITYHALHLCEPWQQREAAHNDGIQRGLYSRHVLLVLRSTLGSQVLFCGVEQEQLYALLGTPGRSLFWANLGFFLGFRVRF